jgi:hypothetical protein
VNAPVNTLGIRRVMFAVDGLDALVARMRAHGAELIAEMQYGTRTGWPTSEGRRASSSRSPSSSANACLAYNPALSNRSFIPPN